jgi:hypothetical protein
MNARNSKRRILAISVAIGLLAISTAVFSQNVNADRHPNLFAAQTYILQAIDKLAAAQKANDYDMGGHAAKAKELLKLAYDQIKLAAEAANAN